jgi:hypothetical protein
MHSTSLGSTSSNDFCNTIRNVDTPSELSEPRTCLPAEARTRFALRNGPFLRREKVCRRACERHADTEPPKRIDTCTHSLLRNRECMRTGREHRDRGIGHRSCLGSNGDRAPARRISSTHGHRCVRSGFGKTHRCSPTKTRHPTPYPRRAGAFFRVWMLSFVRMIHECGSLPTA